MPSDLGALIRATRTEQDIGLREFARRIEKSPAFVTQLECEEAVPSVAEDTLTRIAAELDLDPGTLFVLARRTPRDMVPATELEFALYRRVKTMSAPQQEELLKKLEKQRGKP